MSDKSDLEGCATEIIVHTIVLFIGGWIVMTIWNYLFPSMFGFPEITYWQALLLRLLALWIFQPSHK